MIHGLGLGLSLFALWLSLSGHYTPMLIGLGSISCVLIVLLMGRLRLIDREAIPLHLGFRIFVYWAWLAREIAKANIAVARIILSPRVSLDPCFVRFKSTQKTDLARVIFANSITLTPGTVSVEIEGDDILVHALTAAIGDPVQGAIMDAHVSALERASGER